MRAFLVLAALAVAPVLAADPKGAPPPKATAASAVFADARLPGRAIQDVLKDFPNAKETAERCLHEGVPKARLDCTRFDARNANLGFQLEFTQRGTLIRSAEYAIVKDAAEGERVYKQRVAALTKAFGKGRESTATPSAGLKEMRTAWTDKPAARLRAGVVLITKPDSPAMILDYVESQDPRHF